MPEPQSAETVRLSGAALALLRDYRGDVATDDSNRGACRELAREGLLVAGHSFSGGWMVAAYRRLGALIRSTSLRRCPGRAFRSAGLS